MDEKKCDICSMSFTPVKPWQLRCSKKCVKKAQSMASFRYRSRKPKSPKKIPMLESRTCKACLNLFTAAISSGRIFCSRACCNKARRLRNQPVARTLDGVCEYCSTPFRRKPTARKKQRFCSPKCSKKARNAISSQERHEKFQTNAPADCLICKSPLPTPRIKTMLMCSKECRKRHSNKRKNRAINKNPALRLRARLSNRLREMLQKRGTQKTNSIIKYLGCSPKELCAWIESQWEKGMDWSTYGVSGWHIDHVLPIARFDVTNENHLMVALNWRNLRPLGSTENCLKQDDMPDSIMPELSEMAEKAGVLKDGKFTRESPNVFYVRKK